MMARLLGILLVLAVAVSSGCCTMPCGPGGACGQRTACLCLPCLPKPIVWNGCGNECGPCPGESCSDYCCGGGCGILGHGGLFPWLRGAWSCGRGCSEVYTDEWLSDPPDCCDPCDQCHGCFTGPQGNCCLGPAQRVLAAMHGYKYCAAPNCGPWRPIFGHCSPCGPHTGSCGCGDAGCSSCGGAHGAHVYYDGPTAPHETPTTKGETIHTEGTSILNENWNQPRVKPEPGKPIHNAQQPSGNQVGRRMSGRTSPPGQVVSRPTQTRTPVGNGVRQASY
jgi:hypothetical protein